MKNNNNIYNQAYEKSLEIAVSEFYEGNYLKKYKVNSDYLSLKDIVKNIISPNLPSNFDEKFLELFLIPNEETEDLDEETSKKLFNAAKASNFLSILINDYLLKDNAFIEKFESELKKSVVREKLEEKEFFEYLDKNVIYSPSKIRDLKASNLEREVRDTKMGQDTELEKLLFKTLSSKYAKKQPVILPKIVVPQKTDEQIQEDIKEDLEDLKDISRLEKMIADRFYAYVLIRYGKTKRDLLNYLNDSINHSNLYREEYNKEIDKALVIKDKIHQRDYVYDERGTLERKLPILPNLEELPRDYYRNSIYSEDFFATHEREKHLVEQIDQIKIEEEKKVEREKFLTNKLHTYKLILRHRLGFSNEQVSDMDDQTVISIVNQAREHGILDKEKDKEENTQERKRS